MSITRVTSKSTKAVIDALHQTRLDRDLTYEQLARAVGLSPRNLFRVMNDRNASIQDRTLHKIRRFLQLVDPAAEPKTAAEAKAS